MNSADRKQTPKKRIEHSIKQLEDYLASLDQQTILKKTAPISPFDQVGSIVSHAKAMTDIANKITDIIDGISHGRHAVHTISHGLHFSSFILSIVNFVKTPAEYLYAWIKGETVKDTYSKSARWVQSAMVMSLGALAFFLPAGGPAFALGAVFIGLGASAISLSNLYFNRSILQDKLKKITASIKKEEKIVHEQGGEIVGILRGALNNSGTGSISENALLNIEADLELFKQHRENLQRLEAEKIQVASELRKKGSQAVMDRVVSIGISLLMVIALTLNITASPLGPTLLTTGSLIGTFYMITRITPLLYQKASSWIGRLMKSSPDSATASKYQNNQGIDMQVTKTASLAQISSAPNQSRRSLANHTFFEPSRESETIEALSKKQCVPAYVVNQSK